MKSITQKLSIIILSLLASTYTFAFNSEQVCAAMNEALGAEGNSTLGQGVSFYGPIKNIYSRETSEFDTRGEVCGTIYGGLSEQKNFRYCGQSGLECSGDTCHVNKKWADCGCTSGACQSEG